MRILSNIAHRLRRLAAPAMVCGLVATPAALRAQQPIQGAPGWLMFERLPGVDGPACTARINGPEANTTLTLNNAGVPLLIAGRPDWDNNGGEIEVSLSIDATAPVTLQGGMVLNLVLTMIDDPALLQRLRGAHTLDWTFPFGQFRAAVTGLGAALDAVRACWDRGR